MGGAGAGAGGSATGGGGVTDSDGAVTGEVVLEEVKGSGVILNPYSQFDRKTQNVLKTKSATKTTSAVFGSKHARSELEKQALVHEPSMKVQFALLRRELAAEISCVDRKRLLSLPRKLA
jgi:hypothetical protein